MTNPTSYYPTYPLQKEQPRQKNSPKRTLKTYYKDAKM